MSPTVRAESDGVVLFGKDVADMQSNIAIDEYNKFSGTLKFIEGGLAQSGPLAGDGYFLAFKFEHFDDDATSVLVGLDPSEGTGLVEILTDPDKNGVFKITNKNTQKFKVVTTDGTNTVTSVYDLSGLVLEQ